MTTAVARPVHLPVAAPRLVVDLELTWGLLSGLALWWGRFWAAWIALATRELGAALPGLLWSALVELARLVFVRAPVWAWRLPRENQAVLAMMLGAGGLSVFVAYKVAAETRTMVQVFGPPAWVLGGVLALFIAKCLTRPIVGLVPFALGLWWVSPRAAVVLVTLSVVAATWTTKTKGARGFTTSRGTLTGARIVSAHYDAPKRGYAPGGTGGVAPSSRFVGKHEGGHGASLIASGGTLIACRAFADGSGYCQGKLPCRNSLFQAVVDDVAWSVGGEVAVHSSAGCSSDHGFRDSALKLLPEHQRPMARTAGYANARRAQSTHRHIQQRVMKALMATGRYDH